MMFYLLTIDKNFKFLVMTNEHYYQLQNIKKNKFTNVKTQSVVYTRVVNF